MRALLVYSNRTRDLILAPPIGLSYVAPPYCRILPKLLGFPPLHALRRRHTLRSAACRAACGRLDRPSAGVWLPTHAGLAAPIPVAGTVRHVHGELRLGRRRRQPAVERRAEHLHNLMHAVRLR